MPLRQTTVPWEKLYLTVILVRSHQMNQSARSQTFRGQNPTAFPGTPNYSRNVASVARRGAEGWAYEQVQPRAHRDQLLSSSNRVTVVSEWVPEFERVNKSHSFWLGNCFSEGLTPRLPALAISMMFILQVTKVRHRKVWTFVQGRESASRAVVLTL